VGIAVAITSLGLRSNARASIDADAGAGDCDRQMVDRPKAGAPAPFRRVLFMRTTDLVQRLQVARRELGLEAAITKLDKYQLLILDDIAYVTKDQAETGVLFELIAVRYERRSLLITANQPFGEWGKIFADQAMTLAAIDRLVHHATILEMNVESYRRKAALKRKRGPGN